MNDTRFDMHPKIRQMRSESLIAIGMFFGLACLWYLTAFIWGYGDPSQYTFVLGLPLWTFIVLIIGGVAGVVAQVGYGLYIMKDDEEMDN